MILKQLVITALVPAFVCGESNKMMASRKRLEEKLDHWTRKKETNTSESRYETPNKIIGIGSRKNNNNNNNNREQQAQATSAVLKNDSNEARINEPIVQSKSIRGKQENDTNKKVDADIGILELSTKQQQDRKLDSKPKPPSSQRRSKRKLQSCTGENACKDRKGFVGAYSCNGSSACEGAGYGSIDFTVYQNGCNGEKACMDAAYYHGEVLIYSDSCNGIHACREIGLDNGKITVEVYSCLGEYACRLAGGGIGSDPYSYPKGLVIQKRSCIGTDACRYAMRGASKNFEHVIGEYSCIGYKSCYRIGYDASKLVTVGSNSCSSEDACKNLGKNANQQVTVGDGSCNGFQACYFADNHPITIGNGSCNCDGCCKDVEENSVIGDCQCNNPDDPCSGYLNLPDAGVCTDSPTLAPSISSVPSTLPTIDICAALIDEFLSDSPTEIRSNVPTLAPTSFPSSIPSNFPSLLPTFAPSEFPSSSPSLFPSEPPSSHPTTHPSDGPTSIPSTHPTTTAPTQSQIPSIKPSRVPTMVPSVRPSNTPSAVQSSIPSQTPTITPPVKLRTNDELIAAVDDFVSNNSTLVNAVIDIYGKIENWDVSAVTDFSHVFSGSRNANVETFNYNIGSWDISNATDLSFMFQSNTAFDQDLTYWNTQKVTTFEGMFDATVFSGQGLGSWDVSNGVDFAKMFRGNTVITGAELELWQPRSAEKLSRMFYLATSMTTNLCVWNDYLSSSSTIDVQKMFLDATSCSSYDMYANNGLKATSANYDPADDQFQYLCGICSTYFVYR